jgi:acyl carrier protein
MSDERLWSTFAEEVAKTLGVPIDDVRPDVHIKAVEGVDSLTLAELAVMMSERFQADVAYDLAWGSQELTLGDLFAQAKPPPRAAAPGGA